MTKLKMWKEHSNWDAAEKQWEHGAQIARQKRPIRKLDKLPIIAGITPDTAKNLKWNSLKWMIAQDHDRGVLKGFLRHPFKYGWRYLISLFKSKSYKRDGDFFLYGIDSEDQFKELLKQDNTVFVLGFSYCHKPFECPSGRFTPDCMHDAHNMVCRQCFIGKAFHAAPENTIILSIPTIHYIGKKIFEIVHQNPEKQVLFLITACELTLEMFGDWGNMAGIKGVGVRLDGRICNTMKAFELSEKGVKPGLTVVLDHTQKRIMNLLRARKIQ